jgi:hypothetical protein
MNIEYLLETITSINKSEISQEELFHKLEDQIKLGINALYKMDKLSFRKDENGKIYFKIK